MLQAAQISYLVKHKQPTTDTYPTGPMRDRGAGREARGAKPGATVRNRQPPYPHPPLFTR